MKKVRFVAGALVWITWALAAVPAPGQYPLPKPAAVASGTNPDKAIASGANPDRGGEGQVSYFASRTPLDRDEVEAECGESCRWWARADYLLWWMKPVCLKPPTLTVGSPGDAIPGAFGQPNTQQFIGAHKFEFSGASGIRPAGGVWLTADPWLALEAEGLLLERVAASESFRTSDGGPATYIPYVAPNNTQQALPFSIPGVVNGSSTAVGSSRLWGVESNLAANFSLPVGDYLLRGAFLAGFRYLNLEDRVTVTNVQSLVGNPSAFASGEDMFTTRNHFYGPQLGWRIGVSRGDWSFEYQNKLAAGETHLVSQIAGQPLQAGSPLAPGLLPGPLLALPSNIGRLSSDRVSLVPEVALKARYQVTDHVAVSLGYSLIYWNKILCPGDQMDSQVNVTQLPGRGPITGPELPPRLFVFTDYFAQGLTAGLEVRF